LQVVFGNRTLQRTYEDFDTGCRQYGPVTARKYIGRIEALYAAPNFEAIKRIRAFRAHELKGQRKGEWSITLTRRARLIVVPSADEKAVRVEEVSRHYGD
jgi:plasmid maintenance system killer protein